METRNLHITLSNGVILSILNIKSMNYEHDVAEEGDTHLCIEDAIGVFYSIPMPTIKCMSEVKVTIPTT